eukprot:2853900-Rhodomonas_salina.2
MVQGSGGVAAIDKDPDIVVERIKNRFNPSYDPAQSAGCRDVALNVPPAPRLNASSANRALCCEASPLLVLAVRRFWCVCRRFWCACTARARKHFGACAVPQLSCVCTCVSCWHAPEARVCVCVCCRQLRIASPRTKELAIHTHICEVLPGTHEAEVTWAGPCCVGFALHCPKSTRIAQSQLALPKVNSQSQTRAWKTVDQSAKFLLLLGACLGFKSVGAAKVLARASARLMW